MTDAVTVTAVRPRMFDDMAICCCSDSIVDRSERRTPATPPSPKKTPELPASRVGKIRHNRR